MRAIDFSQGPDSKDFENGEKNVRSNLGLWALIIYNASPDRLGPVITFGE